MTSEGQGSEGILQISTQRIFRGLVPQGLQKVREVREFFRLAHSGSLEVLFHNDCKEVRKTLSLIKDSFE